MKLKTITININRYNKTLDQILFEFKDRFVTFNKFVVDDCKASKNALWAFFVFLCYTVMAGINFLMLVTDLFDWAFYSSIQGFVDHIKRRLKCR